MASTHTWRTMSQGRLRLLLAAGLALVTYKAVREAMTTGAGVLPGPGASAAAAAVICGSLLLCRRWPVAVAVLATAGFLLESQIWPAMVALYNVTVRCPTPYALGLTGAAFVPAALGPFRDLVTMPQATFMPCASLVIPLAFGLAARSQRDVNRLLARRLDDLAAANELRDDRVRLAERARIAREMHDVLAHRLSLLVLHTGVLQRRATEVSGPVGERLGLLRETSIRALDDLRDVLGALRDQEGPVPLTPTADDLPALIAEAEAAGTRVDAQVDSRALTELPVTVRLAVHRIVQEALTNARKHAPGEAVRLAVQVRCDRAEVRAENACPGAAGRGSRGYGLVGVGERVAALGGQFSAGPVERGKPGQEGRFVLCASLPVHVHAADPVPEGAGAR